jgi:hypothetical protein
MKRIICSICIGTLALSVTAWGKENNARFKSKGKAGQSAVVQRTAMRSNHVMRNASQFRATRSMSTARFNRSSGHLSSRVKSNAVMGRNNLQTARFKSVQQRNFQTASAHLGNNVARKRFQNFENNRSKSVAVARAQNFNRAGNNNVTSNVTRNFAFNRRADVRITNNWRGDRFSGAKYAAFRNYNRQWHHRDWWRHHHSRIVFYFGAPYYWDTGYWYPAWGYYPDYVYSYDGPIYGYNDLSPDQVLVTVQQQLQREGYYAGPVDGMIGPMTRQAIAAYQADHGLAITSAVDEPTLSTLGLG